MRDSTPLTNTKPKPPTTMSGEEDAEMNQAADEKRKDATPSTLIANGEAVDIKIHPEHNTYTASDWAMLFIESYGQFGGAHHKAWVLDQVARILMGTPVRGSRRRWSNGETHDDATLGEPSAAYKAWRETLDEYDEGIP